MLDSGSPSAVGQRVPDYELLRRIGSGAYGEVWLARSNATGALRAAKIVWRSRFEDERPYQREFEGLQRFERISREHPSQLALFHIGRNNTEGYFYYVMELADGIVNPNPNETRNSKSKPSAAATTRHSESGLPAAIGTETSDSYTPRTLRADLANGKLPAASVLEIGLALSEALAHLHDNGLVHRDVKPSNVIFVNGRPKLADIGLVTDASDQCSIVGTEGYLPPEGPGTPQADIFALGKVLYEAATGMDRREFPKLPQDLRDWPDAKLVAELNAIVLRACAKDTLNRYKSALEVLNDLARLTKGRSVLRHRIWRERLRTLRSAGFVTAAIMLAAGGGAFLWQTARHNGAPVVLVDEGDETMGSRDPKALEAYQLGLQALRSETPEGAVQALANFNKAIEIDSRFAGAYARAFEAYLMSEDHGGPDVTGKVDKLNEIAATLRKIAPTNTETHAITAVQFLREWRWNEAEREFKEALRINPDCRLALTYYGYYLTRLRRSREAREVLEKAQKRHPASAIIATFLGHCDYARRDFNAALDSYQDAFNNRNRSYPGARYWAGRACMAMTNYFEGLRQLEKQEEMLGLAGATRYENFRKAVEKNPNDPRVFWVLLIEEQKPNEPNTSTPYRFAARYAHVGDKEHALQWLGKALAMHDGMQDLLFDECWDPYRQNSAFQEIVKKVGLGPWQ
jgi:tetratricopeptide (TPR) repeat protein